LSFLQTLLLEFTQDLLHYRRFAREHLLPFTIYRPSIIVGDSTTGQTICYKGFYAFVRALSHIKEIYLRRTKGVAPGLEKTGLPQEEASVEIPIRIFGAPEGLINLVPVDYVVGAICELSKRPEAQGKTFHLTNPHPITLAQLTDKVVRALGIKGVSVSCQEPSSPNPLERLFLHYTKPYLPYLQGRLSFDASNTRNLLNGTAGCLKITQSLVSLFVNRAIEDCWGTREEKMLTIATGGSVCGAIA
jgi:nucleoside-diphosphate-sugar epimerase